MFVGSLFLAAVEIDQKIRLLGFAPVAAPVEQIFQVQCCAGHQFVTLSQIRHLVLTWHSKRQRSAVETGQLLELN